MFWFFPLLTFVSEHMLPKGKCGGRGIGVGPRDKGTVLARRATQLLVSELEK